MLVLKELNPKNFPTTPEIDQNLQKLLDAVNKVRVAYGKPMTVTSGLRSMKDQMRINPKAPKSKHLMGQACDIYDPNRELQAWCKANLKLLEELGLYMEDFSATPTWVHFQSVSPRSGKRFFLP